MKCCQRFLIVYAFVFFNSNLNAAPIMSTSAKASALGNAVTAEAVGTDSASFNPATLTQLHMGPKGKYRDYKLLMLPFPEYSVISSKPSPENDPYVKSGLIVNDCSGVCLLGDDPRDNPWNPELERVAFYIPGYGEIDLDVEMFKLIVAPMVGQVHKPSPDSRFVFSYSLYVPMIGGAHLKAEDWNIKPTSVAMGGYGFAPSFAYKVNDSWSVGGGIDVSIAGMKVASDYRHPGIEFGALNMLYKQICELAEELNASMCDIEADGPFNPNSPLIHFTLEAQDNFNFGFNLGVLWEPRPWFSWGLTYRKGAKWKMEGSGEIILSDGLQQYLLALTDDLPFVSDLFFEGGTIADQFTYDGVLDFNMPAKVDTGISVWVTSRLKVNVDYHWRQSSVMNSSGISISKVNEPAGEMFIPLIFALFSGTLDLGMPQSIKIGEATPLGIDFKNVGTFAFGVSYKYSDRLTLRGGYEKKPMSMDGIMPLGILDDIDMYGIGFSYKWDNESTLDATYVRLSLENEVAAGESLLTATELQPVAIFAGTDLSSFIEANIFQFSWSKRI